MYGAIIGDVYGAAYEFDPVKTTDFPFPVRGSDFTDDTVMTMAVAEALLRSCQDKTPFRKNLVELMQLYGRRYPDRGYGGRFARWLVQPDPQPYNSFGNGSAMRVSPCGLIATTLDEALQLAQASADVTHNHPLGIAGAQAVAAAIFMAKTGRSKEDIRSYVVEHFYPLDKTVDEIREVCMFDETCQGSVGESIQCFLESADYEDAVRKAVSLGADADTQAAIAGSIAWAYYRVGQGRASEPIVGSDGRTWPQWCEDMAFGVATRTLPDDFVRIERDFDRLCCTRAEEFQRTGTCEEIVL